MFAFIDVDGSFDVDENMKMQIINNRMPRKFQISQISNSLNVTTQINLEKLE